MLPTKVTAEMWDQGDIAALKYMYVINQSWTRKSHCKLG